MRFWHRTSGFTFLLLDLKEIQGCNRLLKFITEKD